MDLVSDSEEPYCPIQPSAIPAPVTHHPSFAPKGIEVFSLNVGPLGAYSAGAEITAMVALNPGAIFLQDLRVYDFNSVRRKRRTVEQHLKRITGYAATADLTTSRAKGRAGGTAVLLHPRLSLRSSRLDITAVMDDAPKRLSAVLKGRCAAVRTLALDSEGSTIWMSIYAPTATHPDNATFYEALLELESRILSTAREQVVIGGDFNATFLANQRHGYTSLSHAPADLAFRDMVHSSELALVPNARPTYHSTTHPCRATLDHFLLLDPVGHKLTLTAPTILNLDHTIVCLELGPQAGRELPRPSLTPRPAAVDMTHWPKLSHTFKRTLEFNFVPQPSYAPVDEALSHFSNALDKTATSLLGLKAPSTGIPHRTPEQKVLLDRLRLYKAGIRELEAAIDALGQGRSPPLTLAMRCLWERLQPPISPSHYLTDFLDNHDTRLATFRTTYKTLHERHSKIVFKQRTLRIREYTEHCRARMQDPSSGEIARLLGKHRDQGPMYAIRSEVPDTLIVITDLPPSPSYRSHSPGKFQLGPLPSPTLLAALLALPVSTQVTLERQGPAVVTSSEDILSVWEYHYTRQSASTRWHCTFCSSNSCAHFPCHISNGAAPTARQITTVCLMCKHPHPSRISPPQSADSPPPPAAADAKYPSIPPPSPSPVPPPARAPRPTTGPRLLPPGSSLNAPFLRVDLDHKISSLATGKSILPGSVKNEWLKSLPDRMVDYLLSLLNKVLVEGQGNSWKSALVKLIQKDGATIEPGGYRPIALLDTVHKLFTSLMEDRIRALAEQYDLFGPSQEGFRSGRSCPRQTQVLKYLVDRVRRAEGSAYVSYFDFSSAFDSPDHEYMINVLEDLGFENTDIIRRLYADTYLRIDTPVGVTAPIPKFRGTAQGDPLSPCLFNLVIGVLLRRLVNAKVGVPIDRDTRVGALAFADDLATVTTTLAIQQAAIDELELFEKESGMRLNIKKCMLTGFDFRNNEDLPPTELTYKEAPFPPVCILPGSAPFRHLGCRYALSTSHGTSTQRKKVIADAKTLGNIMQGHVYLPEQAFAVAKMVLHSSFLFSSSTAAWDEPSLRHLQRAWNGVAKIALKLTRGTSTSMLQWSAASGGLSLPQPKALLLQGLLGEVSRLVAHPDHARLLAQDEMNRLINRCGTSDTKLMGVQLLLENRKGVCSGPVEQLIMLAADLGETLSLPAPLTTPVAPDTWLRIFVDLIPNEHWPVGYPMYAAKLHRARTHGVLPTHCTQSEVAHLLSTVTTALELDNPRTRQEHSRYLDRLWDRRTPSGLVQGPITSLLPLQAPPAPPTPDVGVLPDLLRILCPTLNGQPARASDFGNKDTRLNNFSRRKPAILRQLACLPSVTLALESARHLLDPCNTEQQLIYIVEQVRCEHYKRIQRGSRNAYRRGIADHYDFSRPPAVSGNSWQPETIRALRGHGAREEMLVKWLGWPEKGNTWISTKPSVYNNLELTRMLASFRAGLIWPSCPPPHIDTTREGKSWGTIPEVQDPGPLNPSLVTIHLRPTSDLPDSIGAAQLQSPGNVTTVYLSPDSSFRINTARLGLLLDQQGVSEASLLDIQQECTRLHASEAKFPVLSQQAQEFLTRDTPVRAIRGCNPLTAWAGLNTDDPSDDPHNSSTFDYETSSQPPALWFIDASSPITQCALGLFMAAHDTWIIVLRTSLASSLSIIPGCQAGTNLQRIHFFQRRNSWRSGTTLTKVNRVPLDIWCSHDLYHILAAKIPSLGTSLTPDGKVEFRNPDLWKRELIHSPVGQFYRQLGGEVFLAATDGSLKDGLAGSGAIWIPPSSTQVRSVSKPVEGVQKVFCGETQAIVSLLQPEHIPPDKAVWVLVDCLSVLQGLHTRLGTLQRHKHRLKPDALLTSQLDLALLSRTAPTHFLKVKAHECDPLNELVDEVAKASTSSPRLTSSPDHSRFALLTTTGAPAPFKARKQAVITAVAKSNEEYDRLQKSAKHARYLLKVSVGEAEDTNRTELNRTEMFLSRPNDGRELLGSYLQGPLTKHKRWLVQSITNTFPNRQNLHLWKRADSNLCSCGKAVETNAHIQCLCPLLGSARISAHHLAWRALSSAIISHLPPSVTYFPELVIGTADAIPTTAISPSERAASLDWRAAIQAMPLPDDWVGHADADTEDRDSIERHRLCRQRPDGLLLDLRRLRVYICEFTRAMDTHPDYQIRSDAYKTQKYLALLERLRAKLPASWKVEMLSFTGGVNGSIPTAVWQQHFLTLGIRLAHQHENIFLKASKALFEGHALVIAARYSSSLPASLPPRAAPFSRPPREPSRRPRGGSSNLTDPPPELPCTVRATPLPPGPSFPTTLGSRLHHLAPVSSPYLSLHTVTSPEPPRLARAPSPSARRVSQGLTVPSGAPLGLTVCHSASQRLAVPCRTSLGLAVPQPLGASPCPDAPRCASLCHLTPLDASSYPPGPEPLSASPCPAAPRLASPRPTAPRSASQCLAVPRRASSCHVRPQDASSYSPEPYSASPCPAAPCRASPSLAVPRSASPCLAVPLGASGYLNPVSSEEEESLLP